MKKSLSRTGEERKDRLAVEPGLSVKDDELIQLDQLIELPDRKEITLCEAVTALIYGKARDVKAYQTTHLNTGLGKLTPTFSKELTKNQKELTKKQKAVQNEQTAKLEGLLERVRGAAYAGNIKFRGIQEGADPADGYKDIDPLYFYTKPFFNWSQDVIFHREDEASTVWYFVHLDRGQFVLLLNDMGVSIQQSPRDHVEAEQKTSGTGLAGRPTSIHLVVASARRRLNAGDYPDTSTKFSEQLAEALATNEDAHRVTAKAIRNNPEYRELWRRRPPKIIDPS